jgi:hypothetical protein
MPTFGLSDTSPEYRPVTMAINTTNYIVAHHEKILGFALIAGDIGDVLPEGLNPPSKVGMTAWDGTREGMRNLMASIIYRGEAISDDLIEMRFAAAIRHREAHEAFWPSILEYGRMIPWRDPNTRCPAVHQGPAWTS